MRIGGIVGVTVILVFIFFYQWPQLKKSGRKVRRVFFSLMLLNWVLAVLLVIFPEMPGPGQLIDFIFKPFEPFW
ncbi:hypothetical protein RGU12_09845 [Fredinandcohnia sp. QZ13]|uniref:hypothetical protein n=1 Tax=Fredinandcohnia sp. QZ13 TaxID=3073144 RepID=UPI0028535F26|nr:hypothetical protein [Fredinandcohnia sp. QZ13]MDR4887848.1 hypothetical protein [Fredinandcohnia sp. QZ13]